jgi:uncharacterized membrane protein YdbT with pleckstrin-like domain
MSVEYLRKQLGDNEEILYTERHHWIFPVSEMVKWIFVSIVILVALTFVAFWWLPDVRWIRWGYLVLIIPVVRVAAGFVSWLMNVYVVTNRRVVEVSGVVNKKVMDSSLEKLTDVVLTQRLFGRILGYGDIEVLTAASTAAVNYLKQIRRPLEFKTAMVNAKEELEQEFGGSD